MYDNIDLSYGFFFNWWWSIIIIILFFSDVCFFVKILWFIRVRDSLFLRWRFWRLRLFLKVRWFGFMFVWLRRYLESVLRWNCDFGVFSIGRYFVWLEDEVWKREKSWMFRLNVMRLKIFKDLFILFYKLYNNVYEYSD